VSDRAPESTLYSILGERAVAGSAEGETRRSAGKETVDGDVEMLVLEELTNSA
jgi:hypothetical protein